MDIPEVIEDFYGVYLLYCLNEKYLGRTYIGYTVDPNRRINQHNKGSWAGGARKTSNRGPWKMIMIIHGFPNNISALRFEWAWQNPEQSRRFIDVTNRKKMRTEKQLDYRLRILSEMLRIGPWNRLPLTVRWLAEDFARDFPPDKVPPLHMPICYGPVKSKKRKDSPNSKFKSVTQNNRRIETLKSTNHTARKQSAGSSNKKTGSFENTIPGFDNINNCRCLLCHKLIDNCNYKLSCLNEKCDLICHVNCLAELFLENGEYIPIEGDCPFCSQNLLWGDLIRKMKGCKDVEFRDNCKQDGVHDVSQDGRHDNIWSDYAYDDDCPVSNLNKSFSCDESDG